jgi:glycosyltransferase involved in cell wall biosynthesis
VVTGEVIKTVSIICPVFKIAGIPAQLVEWLSEISSYPQFETIIVHDYSDGTSGIELQSICQQYDNVRFIDGHFGNPGSARNAGLAIATGTWITFWDCDDEPSIANFKDLIEFNKKTNPDICFGRYKVINKNSGSKTDSPTWSDNMKINLKIVALNPGIWRIIFARELLDGVTFWPFRMAEDQVFICEVVLKARKVEFREDMVYTYFTGALNQLTSDARALQDLLPAFKKTIQMFETSNKDLVFFLSLMAARQFISGIRYGNLRTKFVLVVLVSKSKLIIRKHFLNSMKTVVENSLRGF